MSYPRIIWGDPGDQFTQTTTKGGHVLGTLMIFPDGRKFRYCKAGELLVVGETLQGAIDANNLDMAAATGSVGDTYISVTSDNANVKNFYQDGYIYCNKTGTFTIYQVKNHLLLTSGAGDLINIKAKNGLAFAITAGDEFTLRANPWSGVITYPATATAGFAGIACENIASGSFGWCQTGGACVQDTVTAVIEGASLTPFGQAATLDVTGGSAEPIVGYVLRGASSTDEGSLIMLTVD